MIVVINLDDNHCKCSIDGNAEQIAKQFVALTEYLNEQQPIIFERAINYLKDHNKMIL